MNTLIGEISETRAKSAPWVQMLFYGLFCLSLSSVLPGCSTMDGTSVDSNDHAPSIDYAKKKIDWPISTSENAPNLSAAHETTPEEHVQQGDRFQRQGKMVLALTYYEKALALDSSLYEVRLKIGNIFLRTGKPLDAKNYFIKILEKHSDFAPAYEGLGQAYFQMEQFQEAERHLLQAINLNPDLWKPHAVLGIIYDLRGQHMEAIAEHSLAIVHNTGLGELYNNLGVSYSLAGDNRQASIAFQEALRKGASQNQVYNNLGLTLTRLGNYQGALDVLNFEGHKAQAYNNLGVLMLKDGFSQQAIACFEQALEAQPTYYPKASANLKRAHTILRQQIQEGIPLSAGDSSPCSNVMS